MASLSFLRRPSFWIKALLATGTAVAIALVAQTATNYQYVSDSLIQQEARRVAEATVRSVERTARQSRPQTSDEFRALLDDLRADRIDQIDGIALRQDDGTVVAATGDPPAAPALDAQRRATGARDSPLIREWRGAREVLVVLFPCRCGIPGAGADAIGRSSQPGRFLIEVALYRDGLTASFARLRGDAIVNATAAVTMLVLLALIAIEFGPYVRGKELAAQMNLARRVQRDLLPGAESLPVALDVSAECIPTARVGGDFYDVVTLSGGRYAFLVGDVSGHGAPAAMLTGLIYGAISTPPWGTLDDESSRAVGLNELLLRKSSEERFATLVWCSYDPASGTLRYINAGHPPPIWIRRKPDGTAAVDRLADGGPVLGLLQDAAYHTASVRAQAGDLVVMFSDGLVEATNDSDEDFGEDRLIAVVQQGLDQPSRAIRDAILSAVRAFVGSRPLQDDQTLLVVRLPRALPGSDVMQGS